MADQTTTASAAEPRPAATAHPRKLGRVEAAALLLGALLVIGGLSFAAGRVTAPAASTATASPAAAGFICGPDRDIRCLNRDDMGRMGGRMRDDTRGGMNRGGYVAVVAGTVRAIDSSSITIALAGGRMVTIALSDKTTYQTIGATNAAASPATSADLKVGATVAIRLAGAGNLTAAQVLIRNP